MVVSSKTTPFLIIGGLPLLAYPAVLLAGVMSLSAMQMEDSPDSPAFLNVLAKIFLFGTMGYPLIYVASAIAAVSLAKGQNEALAVKISKVPMMFIAGLGILLFEGILLGERYERKSPPREVILKLHDVEYLRRWSNMDEQVFTPRGQETLHPESDQVTLYRYRSVQDEESLASMAAAVLEHHKGRGGTVLRDESVPQSGQSPAEHRIVVVLATPHFSEAVFARFKLDQGTGSSAIYIHREYGSESRNQMNAWLEANRAPAEQALTGLQYHPYLDL